MLPNSIWLPLKSSEVRLGQSARANSPSSASPSPQWCRTSWRNFVKCGDRAKRRQPVGEIVLPVRLSRFRHGKCGDLVKVSISVSVVIFSNSASTPCRESSANCFQGAAAVSWRIGSVNEPSQSHLSRLTLSASFAEESTSRSPAVSQGSSNSNQRGKYADFSKLARYCICPECTTRHDTRDSQGHPASDASAAVSSDLTCKCNFSRGQTRNKSSAFSRKIDAPIPSSAGKPRRNTGAIGTLGFSVVDSSICSNSSLPCLPRMP